MKRLLSSLLVFSLLSSLALSMPSKTRPRKRVPQRGVACATSLDDCPVEGCGGPGTDFALNRAKNRVTPPANAEVMEMTLEQIRTLEQPEKWKVNTSRDALRGPGKEGQAVRVMGFLWRPKREHQESTNCKLDAAGAEGELLTDIHMVLTDHPDDPEATSVTAEITPRVRAKRSDPTTWTQSNILQFKKKFIRVTGLLLLDTEHIKRPLVRATNWEVHPVTKLEVCTMTEAKCRSGQGWKNVP